MDKMMTEWQQFFEEYKALSTQQKYYKLVLMSFGENEVSTESSVKLTTWDVVTTVPLPGMN